MCVCACVRRRRRRAPAGQRAPARLAASSPASEEAAVPPRPVRPSVVRGGSEGASRLPPAGRAAGRAPRPREPRLLRSWPGAGQGRHMPARSPGRAGPCRRWPRAGGELVASPGKEGAGAPLPSRGGGGRLRPGRLSGREAQVQRGDSAGHGGGPRALPCLARAAGVSRSRRADLLRYCCLCLASAREVSKHRKGVCTIEGSVYLFVSSGRSHMNWK